MEDLKTWWVVPCIGQYISLFRSAFNLPEIDIEELEQGLIEDGSSDENTFLPSLFISLLRGFFPSRSISLVNWEIYLCRIIERYWVKREKRKNPLDEVDRFSQLEVSTKVEILYYLCLYRFDCDDVTKAMKSMDAEALRVQSLGSDEQGNVYWYFYGTRLYKEEASSFPASKKSKSKESRKSKSAPLVRGRGRPRKNKPVSSDDDGDDVEDTNGNNGCLTLDSKTRWSVVCTTLADWKVFAQKLKTSKFKSEIALYALITKNFIPVLSEMYEKKEETTKPKLASSSTNRASSRIVNKKVNKKTEVSEPVEIAEKSAKRKRVLSDEHLEKKTRELEEKNFMEPVKCDKESPKEDVPSPTNIRNDNFIDRNLSYEPALVMKLRKVLTSVKLHKDAWPFLYPVDEVVAPCYYDIVKEPVVLLDIDRKIELKVYNNLGQIESDFQKLVSNCRLYNGENSSYTSMAKTLWRVFRKGISQMVETMEDAPTEKANVTEVTEKANTMSEAQAAVTTKSSYKSHKKKNKSKHSKTIEGLDRLAEASQQALQDVGKTEGELFAVDTAEIPLKAKAFPDLNVVTIQNHPPSFVAKCKRSSTSSRDGSDSDVSLLDPSSPASVSSRGSDDDFQCPPSKKRRLSRSKKTKLVSKAADKEDEVVEINQNVSIEKPISPDSRNVIDRNSSPIDNMSNERFSNNESSQGSLKSLRDFGENCPILDISGEVTKGDSLCNNLSSLLSRIIKENQVFQLSDSQQLLYTDNSDSAMSGGSLGPPTLEMSAECDSYAKDSSDPKTSPSVCNDEEDRCLLPPQLEINRDFLGLPPIDEITTVDASAIGISTITSNVNPVTNVMRSNSMSVSETVHTEVSEDIHESSNSTIMPPLMPYSPHCVSKNDIQTLPSISEAFNFKSKPTSPDSNSDKMISQPQMVPHSMSPSISYNSTSMLPNSETVPISDQNDAVVTSASINATCSYPDFSLPRFNNGRSPVTSPPNQIPLPASTAMPLFMNQTSPSSSANIPPSNYAATYAPSTSQSVLGPPLPYRFSTPPNIPDYPLSMNQSVMTTAVNNGWKLPIKQINFGSKGSGTRKDGSPRQIKKKRAVIVTQNQQRSSLPNGTNITKTVCASVSASETESMSEQFIPASSTALCKLNNLVSNTHTKFIDTPRDSHFQPVMTSPTMENSSKLCTSSVFLPYNGPTSESGKLPIPQIPSFWNGKDNKLLSNVPTAHAMPYSFFPVPATTHLDTATTFPNNGNFCTTYSNCRPQPLVSCASSTQPLLFDSFMSPANNAKTNPSMSIPAVGNILAPIQPLHSLSPSSPQQLPDSRTLSPEVHKDLQGFSTQKLGDGIFHAYGIPAAHNLPAQQFISQSFVSLPPSSYMLPVQSSMPSMLSPSLLPNFILNPKSSDVSAQGLADVRPQFAVNRTMYTILPNMPTKIL